MDTRLGVVGVQTTVAAILAATPAHERLSDRCDGWLDLMVSEILGDDPSGLSPEILTKSLADLRALVASTHAQENRIRQLARSIQLLDRAIKGRPIK